VRGRVLIVAGSDSGGGAGIQADIKTVSMLDAYASTAITALTAQNTEGVFGVLPIPPEFIRRQIEVVLDDIGADAIKTGMLHDAAVIDALRRLLIAHAEVVTPNLPEAEILCGGPIRDVAEMQAAGESLLALGCRAALVKGGHLSGDSVSDVLLTAAGVRVWESPRIATRHTHGTGCTLASAIATGLAQGFDIESAVDRARLYVQQAIASAPGLGRGYGPLDHAHPLREGSAA